MSDKALGGLVKDKFELEAEAARLVTRQRRSNELRTTIFTSEFCMQEMKRKTAIAARSTI
jgi:hypothetical protein